MLKKLAHWATCKSPWVCHLNGGSCNNCDIEIVAALMPRFDLERFGVLLQGSPRHADVLICTGGINRQIRDRIIRIYEQTPEPKFVLAVGTCAASGRPFYGDGSYNLLGGVDKIIPVHMYVPGCPPRPDAITYGVLKLLALLNPKIEKLVSEFEEAIPGIENLVEAGEKVES